MIVDDSGSDCGSYIWHGYLKANDFTLSRPQAKWRALTNFHSPAELNAHSTTYTMLVFYWEGTLASYSVRLWLGLKTSNNEIWFV